MAWYKSGTCSVTSGSPTVTGAGTAWVDNVRIGSDGFVGPDGLLYEISKVVSATEITLAAAYKGTTASSGGYAIAPIQGYTKELADKAAALIDQFSDAEATAASSASAAASSASAASDSATAAASSANVASSSASAAKSSADSASASATAASGSASSAKSYADAASASASNAATSEKNASASASAAAASQSAVSADKTQIESDIAQAKLDITTERTAAVSAVEVAQATAISSIQAIEADSVLAGYAKKDELSSVQSDLASQISSKQDASTAVTLGGDQTITGAKTFSVRLNVNSDLAVTGVVKATQFTADNGGNKNIDFFAHGYPITTSVFEGGWSLLDGTFPAGGWAAILTNYGNQSCTGTMSAAAFVQTSDARKKTGLTPIHPDLSSLTAYRYTLEADGKTHVGLVAQEVEKVIPEAVVEDKEGFLALDYSAVVTALVDEVNRLRKRVEALEGVGEN
jgi:hypothetical protein